MELYLRGPKDWGYYQNGFYEPEETNLIKKLVKKDDICLDIGANLGYFSILMARQCKHVYAFEAEPRNASLVEMNLTLNNIKNVTSRCLAVADDNTWVRLFLSHENYGMHRIYSSKSCGNISISIPTIKIDSTGIDPQFIKMDIEGAEMGALIGMANTLKKNKPIVLMEFHPASIEEYGALPKDVYDFMIKLNYDIRLIPYSDIPISYEDLLRETRKEPTGRNIICLSR